MKKIISMVFLLILLLSAAMPTAYAAHHGNHQYGKTHSRSGRNQENCTNSCTFADENGDGICDNCKNVCPDCKTGKDKDGDGTCDDCGRCCHYADADNDGICDHQTNGARHKISQNSVKKSHCGKIRNRHH